MNGEQLVLFDVELYTFEQVTPVNSEKFQFQVEEVQQYVRYEQLELNLFPQQPYQIPRELLILAA
ncbi:hypothetical protein I8751_14125 [Nostocaceae cyanobacterium CENA357]|uniref:Uncharacterized protein n=1 Tax=Atlanticothrix silvestris CENA357 TaxID=1725252 RepID=A0A8J7HJ81_9CYAN|nr:hypothetical protein [Atlanticothrix silvestris]MBH8553488.1 hypothetical protein [Atlanticothrix silvestris CENA357]